MRISSVFVVAALCGMTVPAVAQDFLAPLQEMVEDFTGPKEERRTPPRRTPAAPVKAQAEARPVAEEEPPVPRPRPPGLTVEAKTPAPAPVVEAEPEVVEAPAPVEAEPEVETAPVPVEGPGPVEPPADEAPTPVAEPATPPAPDRVYQVACPAVIQGLVEAELAPPLHEGICGEQSPFVVTGVMSRGRMVPLSSPITTNCEMASALPDWVSAVDGYAEAMLESPLASVTTGTSYMCRARNSAESQFTSEHGFANAIDVVGFKLEDGRSIGVTENWLPPEQPEGRLLRLAHDAACGSFMTVLGPEANAEHNDHLHLDLGCHGKACQTRICQ